MFQNFSSSDLQQKITPNRFEKISSTISLHSILQNDQCSPFIHSFFIYGSLPWKKSTEPVLLYESSLNRSKETNVSQFCFSDENHHQIKTYSQPVEMLSDIFAFEKYKQFILFFPTIEEAPYHYCCYFKVNSLSIPSIAHSKDFDFLLRKMNQQTLFFLRNMYHNSIQCSLLFILFSFF
jgi:hypothetical protein